jgi:hypothetical protein
MSLSVSEPVPPSPITRQRNAHDPPDAWSDPWWRVWLSQDRTKTGAGPTGRGVVTAPIFLPVPQVKLLKRLDLARDAERASDSVPGLIGTNLLEGRQRLI